MIIADKIIRLRKKNGWSQEELAEKTGVSRQAVSKWESAQTVPDLTKILLLSQLFGVTTDYLLKDEIEDEEFTLTGDVSPVKKISMTEANAFLTWRREAAKKIAAATFLCILSPVPLLILGAATTVPSAGISEKFAGCLGLSLLLVIVAIAAAVFVAVGQKNAPYEFLDKENFETEYGVIGMAKERQKEYRPTYTKYNCIGTFLCVMSPIILFIGAFSENELLLTVLLSFTMLIAGVGVIFFILGGVTEASFKKLLAEGEFSAESKKMGRVKERVSSIYWLAVTAVYLGISFGFDLWERSWIVWPVAGVLFALVMHICDIAIGNKGDK